MQNTKQTQAYIQLSISYIKHKKISTIKTCKI